LIEEVLLENPQYKQKFKKHVSAMVRVLKGLSSTYSAEFEINGVSDPFLQI
jgi:AP-1 complex subunit gamma-1